MLHGIGGIGKSSLAAQVVEQLGAEAGLVVTVSGTTKVDLLLDAIRQRLHGYCLRQGVAELDPLRQLVTALTDASPPWSERLGWIADVVLSRLPILLLLDNAEDLLTTDGELADAELAEFVVAWMRTDGARLIVTSRYPLRLPGRAERRLTHHHLGPLSAAETRKLLWRLPALDALTGDQRQRAYRDVGGHPRSLEYLDALLAGGTARFDDVADRVETALADRGVDDPDAWLAAVKGDMDRALAETVTLAADDVLLDALLARLHPLARDLLFGAAVYEEPVDDIGLAWQVADELEVPADPERDERMRQISEILDRATREQISREEAGLTPELEAQWNRDWTALRRPPLADVSELTAARDLLLRTGLLSPVSSAEEAERYLVHRWTATALADRTSVEQQVAAHRLAARYWQWRVRVWPQDRVDDVQQLLLARTHFRQAGDLDEAVSVTYTVRDQLHLWGAWAWEHDLCVETLGWLPDPTDDRSAFLHQLGMIAESRGEYGEAERWYRDSLAIDEELGNRSGIAISYHQLGMIAQDRGEWEEAERRYQAALAIGEELGDQSTIAGAYHQLGWIAQERGEMEEAERRYQASLAISEELGDLSTIAGTYHQLGMIAHDRGDWEEAERRYRASLSIEEELGNRSGIAISYHELGRSAQVRGEWEEAERLYQDSLAISEELGNRSAIAGTTSQLGVLRTRRQQWADAVPYQMTALALRLEIGSPQVGIDVHWLTREREELGDDAFRDILTSLLDADDVDWVMENTTPDST